MTSNYSLHNTFMQIDELVFTKERKNKNINTSVSFTKLIMVFHIISKIESKFCTSEKHLTNAYYPTWSPKPDLTDTLI
jgi:hypothetical protein